jgi:glycosyltransferase involved in cell wall biosynthesis
LGKQILALNAQHRNVRINGGVGRYCAEFYKYLKNPENSGRLSKWKIELQNFHETIAELDDEGHVGKKLTRLLKAGTGWLRSGLGSLQSFEEIPVTDSRHNDAKLSAAHCPAIQHELTSYSISNEVRQRCNSANLALAVTFLDLQDLYYPQYFSEKILLSRRTAYEFYKNRADLFFAISNFTKNSMVGKLGIEPNKIVVTHLASDDVSPLELSSKAKEWSRQFGRFWLYPAKYWKHKNHDFLLRVLGRRATELKQQKVTMILTGGYDEQDSMHLVQLINEAHLHDVVEMTGFVTDSQLGALMESAEFLFFPSLFEGFGMPVLEAMKRGCPVISSNIDPLLEICGDAAIYFDPVQEDELLSVVDLILSGEGIQRKEMIQKGYQNCQRFSWKNTFDITTSAYADFFG